MPDDRVYLADEVVKKENKYLTKVVGFAVTALISSHFYINKLHIEAINDKSEQQIEAINGNKTAVNELTKAVNESTVANNNRFNQIDNRIDLGREQGSAVVKEFRREFQLIWEAIKELRK